MRTYTVIDLLRFHTLSVEHPDLSPIDRIKLYNQQYKEISEEQKMENLRKFLIDHAKACERKKKT